MGYLVLARKYRPQAFSDMTGQEHVVQTLSNALRSGRVAHALLFCGPRGCGKTTTARIVAKALNCEKGPTPEPCGVCTPCREITAGTDVDVQEIDAASNTGVDNVRELRESAKYLPARDRFKIFIVDEVHMLSKAAFNAFLKTLEEPPGHVKFLFATTDPQALPDTILSRCQRHNFRLVPLKQISERIRAIAQAENVVIDDGAVALVARQAAGSMRDSLSILDQLFSSVGPGVAITEALAAQALGALDRSVVSDLAAALVARDARGVLAGVARAYDGGHDLKRLTEDLATHVRNLLASSVAGAPLDLPDHELRTLRDQAAAADPAELARLFDIVHAALFDISRANQPRHALEIALLKAVYLAPASSVQALLGRADELARKLGAGPTPGPGTGGGSGPGPRSRPSFEAAPPAGGSRSEPWATTAAPSAPRAESLAPPPSAASSAAPVRASETWQAPPPTGATPATTATAPMPAAAASHPASTPPRPAPDSFVRGAVAAAPEAASAAPPMTAAAPFVAPAVPGSPSPSEAPGRAPVVGPSARPDFGTMAVAASMPPEPAPAPSVASAATSPVSSAAAKNAAGDRKPWERHLSLVSGGGEPASPTPQQVGGVPAGGQGASGDVTSARPDAQPPASRAPDAPLPTGSGTSAPVVAGPAPGAERPAPPLARPPSDLSERWPSLVDGVRGRRRALGSLLEHARPLAFEGAELTLGFERGDFHAQGLQGEKQAVEVLLGELMGTRVALRIVELSAEQSAQVASLAESVDRAEREARDARLREGREHPAIRQAAAILGADIEDVRDLGGVMP